MTRRDAAACVALCAAVAVLALASRIAPLARVEVIVPLVLLAQLAWMAAIRTRPRRATVIGVTAVLAVLCAIGRPVAEDDYWRFLWDGFRSLSDGTPYGGAPAEWFGDHALPPAMQAVLDGINHPEVPTIYGPLLQVLFLAAHLVAPADPLALSVQFGALHVACTAAATYLLPARRVAWAAWNPLLLQQCLVNLHPDFLLGWLLLAAAIAARRGAAGHAGALLAAAVATKVAALAAAPAIWIAAARASPAIRAGLLRGATAGAAVLAALYLPWIAPGATELRGLATFADVWRFNPALFGPLAAMFGDAAARLLAAGLVAAAAFAIAARATPRRTFGSVVLALATLLAFSPVINAWYLAWLLPCAAMTRWRTPWVAAAALPLSALTVGELGLAGEPFAIPGVVLVLQWGAVSAALLADLHAHRRRTAAIGGRAAGERAARADRSAPGPGAPGHAARESRVRRATNAPSKPRSPSTRGPT